MAAVRIFRVFVVVLVVALVVWFHDFKSPPTRDEACSPYVTSTTEKIAHGATRVGDILHQLKDDATAWTETQIDEAVKGAGLVVGIVWRAFKLASKLGKVKADQAVTGMVPTPINCAPCPADSSNDGDSGSGKDTWDPRDAALSQPLAQVGASWSKPEGVARTAARRYFPAAQVNMAVAVAGAESRWRSVRSPRNRNGSFDHGFWQINTVHKDLLAAKDWRDPYANGWMAYQVWLRAGRSWSPWTTFNSGSYRRFLHDGPTDGLKDRNKDRNSANNQVRPDCTPVARNGAPGNDPKTTAGWDRLNRRTVDQAVAWLERMDRDDTPIRPSMCLHYMGRAYGYNGTGISSAYNAWLAIPASLRHEKDRTPPKGALLFWGPTPANRYGHVAISLGGGRAASTDWPAKGTIGTGSASELIGWPRGEYLGWTSPYFPGRSKMPVDTLRKGAA